MGIFNSLMFFNIGSKRQVQKQKDCEIERKSLIDIASICSGARCKELD